MNKKIKQVKAICFKSACCYNHDMSSYILFTPYIYQLIKQVNQIYNIKNLLGFCIDLIILTVNNVTLGTWVGRKALLAQSLHLTWDHLSP